MDLNSLDNQVQVFVSHIELADAMVNMDYSDILRVIEYVEGNISDSQFTAQLKKLVEEM